jgi:mannose/cellobiose epimerase-like protein (N-acyl-D-glucosamine 2-epimerase family)
VSFKSLSAVRSWMFDTALPWWAANGVDRTNGGYVEQMTLDGEDAAVDFKRTRLTARQIYVFSHGRTLGWNGDPELIRHGLAFLADRTWQGPDKGFARRLTRTGNVLDPAADLYDHAFAMFGFAWALKATGDVTARDWLYRTADFIEAKMRHPNGLGFVNELPASYPRQQNPHMHLTEAALVAHEATGDDRFAAIARETTGLFRSRFFDIKSGTLAEFFTEDLHRAAGEEGRHTEPGHQFEWAWILDQCRRQFGIDLSPEIRAAVAFAERHGVDPATGVTYNAVRDDGVALDRGSRTWPNTERLKAAVAMYELDGVNPTSVFESSCGVLLDRYLAHTPAGTWMDAFDADGKPLARTVAASTLYHVFLAFAEVMRVSARL